jgi:hypothetical protein
MKKKLTILILILFITLPGFGQIYGDTIFYKSNEIRVYTYLLQNDTIIKAYFDKNIPRVMERRKTNLGRMKFDLTFDSITKFVRQTYVSASVTATDIQNVQLTAYREDINPNFKSAITTDCYWIGAINYYTEMTEKDSNDYLNHYELAVAFESYNSTYSLMHDKTLKQLNTCIRLRPDFEDAYLFKARVHEKNGKMKGLMMSEPHHIIVDRNEINLAIQCLDNLLQINPNNAEAKKYREELKTKYK